MRKSKDKLAGMLESVFDQWATTIKIEPVTNFK